MQYSSHLHGVSSPTVDNQTLFTYFEEKAVLDCKISLSKKNLPDTSKVKWFSLPSRQCMDFKAGILNLTCRERRKLKSSW